MVANCFLASVPMLAMFILFALLFFLSGESDACVAAMIGFASGAWTHLGVAIAYSSDYIVFWWMFTIFTICASIILFLKKAENYFKGEENDRY